VTHTFQIRPRIVDADAELADSDGTTGSVLPESVIRPLNFVAQIHFLVKHKPEQPSIEVAKLWIEDLRDSVDGALGLYRDTPAHR